MMSVSAVKAQLAQHGFHSIRTAAGWMPLNEWQPYGEYGAKILFRAIDFDHRRLYEQESTMGYAGVWEFTV